MFQNYSVCVCVCFLISLSVINTLPHQPTNMWSVIMEVTLATVEVRSFQGQQLGYCIMGWKSGSESMLDAEVSW